MSEPELGALMARFFSLADEVGANWHDKDRVLTPERVTAAMAELAAALDNAAAGPAADAAAEVSRLVDQALLLIGELVELARQAGMQETARELELLSIPIVLWSGGKGARIRTIALVVDALAALANRVREPAELARLYRDLARISGSVAPEAKEDSFGDAAHPWRVLVLNRAIVATRTLDPELMEEAYEAVTRQLPEYARHFFEEAMGQMDAIGYPPRVREVVSRYYERLATPRTMH